MTITENPTTITDPRSLFARAVGLGTDVIGAVRPDQLDGATPCAEYDVGESSGAGMLISYLSEITVHTWDLATATGQRPAWDPQVVGLAYDASRFMPGEGRAAMFRAMKANMPPDLRDAPDLFADAVPVPHDAPLIDRIVAWNGRRPQP